MRGYAFPLSLDTPEDFRPMGRKFQELKALEPTPPPLAHLPCPQCMSGPLIRMIDERASLCRNPQHIRNVARKLTKAVRRYLQVNYRRQTEEIE